MKKTIILLGLVSLSCVKNDIVVDQETPVNVEPVETHWVCEDDSGNILTCKHNSDCCEGFICIPDRSISYTDKYCVWSGSGSNQKSGDNKNTRLVFK